MLKQQNLELFETPYVQTIVQFLFSNYQKAIFSKLLPPYILHLAVIGAQVHIAEGYRYVQHQHDTSTDLSSQDIEDLYRSRKYFIAGVILQGVLSLFNTIIFRH